MRLSLAVITPVIFNHGGVGACAELEAGFAAIDITPPVGFRMSGYFYERVATAVHNPLQAKAIVLEQGDQRLAWVFCDLLGVPVQVSREIRDAASAETGIPRENIFVAATHCHTGPLYFGPLRDYFHARAVKIAGGDAAESIDYPQALIDKVTQVVGDAANHVAPVSLATATALQEGLAFNRRYVLKDGSVATNPGKLNPNIVRPAGPIDPELAMLQFHRGGQPTAGLTVFALHLDTTGGTDYAADFAYYLHNGLRAKFGSEYLSAFGIGTCGDVNHIDLSHDRPQKSHAESERIGAAIAATAISALQNATPVESPRLSVAGQVIEAPLQEYSTAEVTEARAKLPKVGTRELPMLEQVAAVKIVGIDDYGVKRLPMEIQAFQLSDELALVALPGELFAELGLAIKQRSPFATTFVVELSNDYPGYIPTRRAFAEGGYEPANSKIAPGGGEMLVEAAIGLLQQLKQERGPAASVSK